MSEKRGFKRKGFCKINKVNKSICIYKVSQQRKQKNCMYFSLRFKGKYVIVLLYLIYCIFIKNPLLKHLLTFSIGKPFRTNIQSRFLLFYVWTLVSILTLTLTVHFHPFKYLLFLNHSLFIN